MQELITKLTKVKQDEIKLIENSMQQIIKYCKEDEDVQEMVEILLA